MVHSVQERKKGTCCAAGIMRQESGILENVFINNFLI